MDRRAFRLKLTHQVFEARWVSSDWVYFARATFSKEELLDYLEASGWLEKNDFLGRKAEDLPPPLILRPSNEK